jgi:phosphatidylserine/phosphatidylglycerophosphate/cardiolipin synthase-like enzyme
MAKVKARAYCSSSMVLLAFDWDEGKAHSDFLGFAIRRSPGLGQSAPSWLPNRLSFQGAIRKGENPASNRNPIQKFMWWDARIERDKSRTYKYTITPVRGTPGNLTLVTSASRQVSVTTPPSKHDGIGTWFNRAVVSSQSFSRQFPGTLTSARLNEALVWLSNGMGEVIPRFVDDSNDLVGALYHLNDPVWAMPALDQFPGPLSLVLEGPLTEKKYKDPADQLGAHSKNSIIVRKRGNFMHNKFLVRRESGDPAAVLMGSANFTRDGLTIQANLLHTFDSPDLAALYERRKTLLATDPTPAKTRAGAGWSPVISVGKAKVRVFFSPETKPGRLSMDTILEAIGKAKKSVIFCIFSSTDKILRDAMFAAADKGRMMFGLVNGISKEEPELGAGDASALTRVEIFHRNRKKRDVYAYSFFRKGDEPNGFWWERSSLQPMKKKITGKASGAPPVFIHHKFILIDAETDSPTIFTGSANFSNNSNYNNDENLLEIKGSTALAQTYLCEFLRLYEHYRARAQFQASSKKKGKTLKLAADAGWAKKAFTAGSPEAKSRVTMAG